MTRTRGWLWGLGCCAQMLCRWVLLWEMVLALLPAPLVTCLCPPSCTPPLRVGREESGHTPPFSGVPLIWDYTTYFPLKSWQSVRSRHLGQVCTQSICWCLPGVPIMWLHAHTGSNGYSPGDLPGPLLRERARSPSPQGSARLDNEVSRPGQGQGSVPRSACHKFCGCISRVL